MFGHSKYDEIMDERYHVEHMEEWDMIFRKIRECPGIKFDPEWEVRVVPPFGGAAARFRVSYNGKEISVYLDWYDRLGYMGFPYYEIYPAANGDVERFDVFDTDNLVNAIRKSFEKSENEEDEDEDW